MVIKSDPLVNQKLKSYSCEARELDSGSLPNNSLSPPGERAGSDPPWVCMVRSGCRSRGRNGRARKILRSSVVVRETGPELMCEVGRGGHSGMCGCVPALLLQNRDQRLLSPECPLRWHPTAAGQGPGRRRAGWAGRSRPAAHGPVCQVYSVLVPPSSR